MEAAEEELKGGISNAGAVFRTGDRVRRPAPRTAPALHPYLTALADRGFSGVPRPLLLDGEYEEMTYLPGDVALPPFPDWACTDTALQSVGALLRRLHDASVGIPFDADTEWPTDMADPHGGPILCHNDVCRENVIFHEGIATALIDFDLAAPGRPLWDVATTARYWVPMTPGKESDVIAKLHVLSDGYGLESSDRVQLPELIEETTSVARQYVAEKVDADDPAVTQAWAARGGWSRWDNLQSWLADNRAEFVAGMA